MSKYEYTRAPTPAEEAVFDKIFTSSNHQETARDLRFYIDDWKVTPYGYSLEVLLEEAAVENGLL